MLISSRLRRRVESIVCQYGLFGSYKPVFGTPFLYARHLKFRMCFYSTSNCYYLYQTDERESPQEAEPARENSSLGFLKLFISSNK